MSKDLEKKLDEKKVESTLITDSVKKDIVADGEAFVISEDSRFVKTDIEATVSGYSYGSKWDDKNEEYVEDRTNFQIQSIKFNDETNKLEKHTIRINVKMTEKQVESMVGKTYLFNDVEVYYIKDGGSSSMNAKRAYSVIDSNKINEIQSSEDVFNVLAETKVKINNIVEETKNVKNRKTGKTKAQSTGNVILQSVVKFGTRADVKNFVIEETSVNEVRDLLSKVALIKDIKSFRGKTGTNYRTSTLPTLSK